MVLLFLFELDSFAQENPGRYNYYNVDCDQKLIKEISLLVLFILVRRFSASFFGFILLSMKAIHLFITKSVINLILHFHLELL